MVTQSADRVLKALEAGNAASSEGQVDLPTTVSLS
jgi:hypothetical protein